jgi:hypothetical protein
MSENRSNQHRQPGLDRYHDRCLKLSPTSIILTKRHNSESEPVKLSARLSFPSRLSLNDLVNLLTVGIKQGGRGDHPEMLN